MTKYLWKKYEIKKVYEEEEYIATKAGDSYFKYRSPDYMTAFHGSQINKPKSVTVMDSYNLMQYFNIVNNSYISKGLLKHNKSEGEHRIDDYDIRDEWVVLESNDTCAFYIYKVEKNMAWCSKIKYLDTNTITINTQGRYIEDIVSENRDDYPNKGEKGGYWYVYQGIANQPPVISGDTTQLGILTNDRSIRFSVSDPDSDAVTVEIRIDGVKTKDSPFVAELGQTYNIPIKIADYKIGEHNVEVVATDTGGLSDSRTWYFERGNSNPTISGKDEDLGDKNSGFQIPFFVNDIDLSDELTIQISLNDRVLQTINNALRNKEYIADIEDGTVYAQELGKLNTIIIKVTDGQGGVSYRYKYFKRTNTAPIISGEDKDIGVVEKAPVVSFSAKDLENDSMTYSVYLNDKELLKDIKLEADKNIDYKLSKNEFSQLDNIKKHRIRIVVTDAQKATSIRNITFKRKLSKCWHKTIRQTDIQATKFYAFVSTLLSEGAELKVEVCNNANDEKPAWEDATVNVKQGTSYIFKNKEKTHKDWAVGLLVTILPGTSKEPSWLLGAGGGFE